MPAKAIRRLPMYYLSHVPYTFNIVWNAVFLWHYRVLQTYPVEIARMCHRLTPSSQALDNYILGLGLSSLLHPCSVVPP